MIVVIPVRSTGPYPVADGIELDSQALYWASAADVVRAAIESGGEVLVNYQGEDASPVETLLADHGIALESLRFEPQVGSTRSARLGNSVTHLLEEEDATSVAVLEPTAPLVRRPVIDGVAMSLRRTDVILGPSLAGGCYVAGYTQPIDFADVYAEQPLEAITDRAVEADLSVDTVGVLPTIESQAGLETVRSIIAARTAAGRAVPAAVADILSE